MAGPALFQKDLPEAERIFYYETTKDDPVRTAKQGSQKQAKRVELPVDYVYIRRGLFAKIYSRLVYGGLKIFARFYAKFYLHLTIKNRKLLKKIPKKQGYVIYGNHTNPFHDAFSPALVADRHIYTISLPANLFIPGIGKFLPYAGIIPLGSTPEQKNQFHAAIDELLQKGNCLVIYPEAHVWPYATKIRPFPQGDRSFVYPVRNHLPVFTMTTTYQKAKNRARPNMTVYLDGPFYPDITKTDDENRAMLAQQVSKSMIKYSKKSNYEYFQYRQKPPKKG